MKKQISPGEALALLTEGNRRFSSGLRSMESALSVSKMQDLAENGQCPRAIVLTCSDSRVPTEMVFDQGLGDLFVIRVAGNVVSPMVTASVEYAVSVLGIRLCVVMGHSQCGAVSTAIKVESDSFGLFESSLTPNLRELIAEIRPSVRQARRLVKTDREYLHDVTRLNVQRSVDELAARSSVIRSALGEGELVTIGAVYDIQSGVVTFETQEATGNQFVNFADQPLKKRVSV